MPSWLRMALVAGVVILVTGAALFGYRWYSRPTTLTIAVGSLDGEATKLMSALASRLAAVECAGAPQAGGNHQRARGGRDVFVEQDRSRRRAGRRRRPVAGAGRHRTGTRRGIACCTPGILDRRHRRLEASHRRSGRRRNEPEGRQRPDGGIRSWPCQCDVPQPRARGDAARARSQGGACTSDRRSPG